MATSCNAGVRQRQIDGDGRDVERHQGVFTNLSLSDKSASCLHGCTEYVEARKEAAYMRGSASYRDWLTN